MKYRRNNKTKRQHGMIKGLSEFLKKIEGWPEIQGIIPGRIEKARATGKVRLRISYETNSGLKAIARGGGAVQEVFFVSGQPKQLSDRLRTSGLIQ